MKKFIITCMAALSFCGLFSQNFWQDYPYLNRSWIGSHSPRNFIIAEGSFNYGCDGLNNEFLNSYYHGGYLDSGFIEKSSESLLPSNRFGVSTISGLTYGHFLNDTAGESFTISLLRRNSISGRFSDDAFHLGFQGNTRFKGEEADFSRTRFTSMSWTQLKFGYLTPNPNGFTSFAFSILAGHKYNQANIEYGKLFTDSQGLELSSSVKGDYWASDTNNTSTFALNGMGTSVDITWLYYHMTKGLDMQLFKVDFLDFGFLNWNNKTSHRFVDTTFDWYGVDVSQLFIDPDFISELPKENDFIKSDTNEFHQSIFLPAVIRATYSRTFFNRKLIASMAFSMPLWSEALPYGSLTASYGITKIGLQLGGGVAYGGYARLQVPLKIEYYGIHGTSLELGTSNALAFINPATIAGNGAYIKLSYCFR